jgi:hypothetical protein
MRNSILLTTLAAATAASAATTCTQATITITAAAQATNLGCDVVSGTLLIEDKTITEVNLDGPKQVGSIIVSNAAALVRLSSSTINSISGMFNMTDLNSLSSLDFSALRSVDEISWVSLDQLPGVTFGSEGVTKVSKLLISDTFISSLDGLNVASVDDLDINNNRKLVSWDSDLVNVTSSLKLQNNGGGAMIVNMPKLKTVASMEVRNVQEFNVNALTSISNLRFEENDKMETFAAPNVTKVDEISFTDNEVLTNVTFPKVTSMDGALTIQNNTALETINGFPKLETIKGTLIFRGDFTQADLPALKNVFGQGTITSTQDITNSCKSFQDLIDDKSIQGDNSSCTSKNQKANEGGDEGTSNSGASNSDDDSAAGLTTSNLLAVVGTAVVGVLALF